MVLLLNAKGAKPPNVLLITVDSLRPDYLGCYGYAKNTSPNIDNLANEGVVFSQAISQGSWTCPSVASIATSTYPSTHNIYFFGVSLSEKLVTIADILKQKGYYNFLCSGHDCSLTSVMRLGRGFDKWTYNEGFIDSDKVNAMALDFLKQNNKRNFFLWIHYMDTHDRFFLDKGNKRDASLKSENIQKYDTAIAKIDAKVGEIIEELKKLNIEENTLIIITADHGEEICEHGRCFAHAAYLWEPLIRVPLIITWKGHLVNKRKSCQVQLIDIAPTICDILKIKKPPYFEGKSLLPLIRGSKCQPRPAFSEHQNRQDQKTSGTLFSTEFSIRLDSWKLICTAYPNWKKYELYDLKNDPGELNDLSEIEKARLDFLKNKLEVWQKRKKPDAVPIEKALHEETRDRLKSLGYLN